MDLRKCIPFDGPLSSTMVPSVFPSKVPNSIEYEQASTDPICGDTDVDIREIYFLIMHFLSAGPCQRTFEHLQKELFQHQLLPRRYHACFSRSGVHTGIEDDDGISFPLSYNSLVERYAHIEKDHLVRLMKQLMLTTGGSLNGKLGAPGAADVPTFLGTGSFSLLDSERSAAKKPFKALPAYLRWPHMQADQVRGLSLREIGGGFRKHQRAPSIRSACYAIAKPSMMVERMQNVKKIRGHRVAVYCAIFDRSGRHVITGSDDRLVKIWSTEAALCLASCRGHEGDITDLAVSSNNALVASSSNDFVIRVWRLPDGMPISVLRGHTGAVTAIAFNPRPNSVYQLLSSSDDGTCRIWDARSSQCTPKIYIPKPLDTVPGRSNVPITQPSLSIGQQTHQILCCAYNANGTVFVTGSSDTLARVWNASKSNVDSAEEPVHEMDILSGHENDVNYVQFSGCSVAPRSSISDTLKEDNIPKFKNSWFCHENIVTCSRDGSAIIWVPRLRRSHAKGGRWIRAYHLKVPPPPLPPQPPRGGPRQRILPTPRGVNMIVWSLDNRFVLAAIMDCRICVWNAADGSLVHSLTGHSESSYVLDVHPFNPRIAMSAGYDGKAIVWDIWEGTPIRVYDIGRVKLVDGKFSPDGTSIVLSDDFGQLHLLNTGEGESQKDSKYDQFFLGDYRPLIRDATGNVLDQESQLPPHRRNIQDPLCDSSMIPYPEPYQTTYQRQRLGVLGIEWRVPTIRFAIGLDFSLGQDYQVPPLADVERLMEPLPEFIEAMYWEPPENEILTDDNDSEFNVAEEYSSEGERCSLSAGFSSDSDGLRRSGRSKHSNEFEVGTSSGRRIKKRNLDDFEGSNSRVARNSKKSKGRKKGSKKQNSRANIVRPQRLAAKNALTMFSQYSGTSTEGEAEDFSEHSSSEREIIPIDSDIESNGTDSKNMNLEYGVEKQIVTPSEISEPQPNDGTRKRLVLKFSIRKKQGPAPSEDVKVDTVVANPNENGASCSADKEELHPNENSSKYEGQTQSVDHEKNETVEENPIAVVETVKEEPIAETVKIHDVTTLENDVTIEDGCNSSLKDPTSRIEQGDPTPVQKDPPQKPTKIIFKTSKPRLASPVEGGPTRGEHNISSNPEQGRTSLVTREVTDRVNSREPVRSKSNVEIDSDDRDGDDDYDDNDDDDDSDDVDADYAATDASRRKRSMKMKATSREPERVSSRLKSRGHDSPVPSRRVGSSRKAHDRTLSDDWTRSSKATRSRSERTRSSRDKVCGYGGNTVVRNPSLCSIKQSWLMLSAPEMWYRYIPQLGDEVAYLTQGHQEFIEVTHSESGPSFKGVTLRAVEICRVEDLKYATSAGSGESCCKLSLRFIDPSSTAFGKTYKLTLPELANFPDFLVEKTCYDSSMMRNWTQRDRCYVWWRCDNDEGGSWWSGRIVSVGAKSSEFPDSPWERYCVLYESEAGERHLHSPWELHDFDAPCERLQIDASIKDRLLHHLDKLERSASKYQDPYGCRKLNEVAEKKEFSNRFPVAIYPYLIQQRLKNDYYRHVDAVKHDFRVMLSNARSYFSSSVDLAKMNRLSDWVEKKIDSIG